LKKISLKYDPRPQQVEILDFVKKSIQSDDKKFIMVDAPTGVGKSYAAVMISDWYINEINPRAKVNLLTNSKILQDQYTKDFDFISSLKGSNSYWCRNNMMACGESKIYNKAKEGAKGCNQCPHSISQSAFVNNRMSLTNFHLITAYSMYSPDILMDRGANLLIIDEAHEFEETFCDFISSVFSKRSLTILDIWEEYMSKDFEEITNIRQLSNYVKKIIIPKLSTKIEDLLDEAKSARSKAKKADLVKKADHCDKSMCKYNRFVKDEDSYATNWIFERELDGDGNFKISVEPIWANQYLKDLFWKQYDHVIFMSGTLLSPKMMGFLMGLQESEYTYISLPCPFPEENRPIVYLKFGKMSYYDKAETFKRSIPIIKKILEKNLNHKGIIHSGNYEFNTWISKSIKDKRLLIHDSSTREKLLNHHLESKLETVLVSPSMINGIDLKDELSRFQIILKVPFPNLRSTKIKKRLETNPDWYNWKALIDIMQSYGRSIRNDQDWAETYILDSCFDQLLNGDIPKYFTTAMKIKKLK
jgi:ATP-dependent DNA helicase DinG